MNDLFIEIDNQKSVIMHIHADYILLFNSGKTICESIENSQKSLDIVTNWYVSNKITINIGKTKFMIISPSNNEYILAKGLHINEIELSQVHVYEY